MTSNAGAADMQKAAIGFGRDKREGEDTAAIERTFTPEFRNRLDAVISFGALPREVIFAGGREISSSSSRAQLMDRNVTIELSQPAAEWLGEKGYDDRMGARPLGRVIQEHIKEAAGRGTAVRTARQGWQRQGRREGRQDRPAHRGTRQPADRLEEAPAADRGLTLTGSNKARPRKGRAFFRLSLTEGPRAMRLALALLAAFALPAAAQEGPALLFPVDCTLGETCFLQQFVDRDPGPGARAFDCGPQSYDGHTGTEHPHRRHGGDGGGRARDRGGRWRGAGAA